MKRVLLGLGSNRAFQSYSPMQLLEFAVKALEKILTEPVVSSVYKTKAMYVENQEDFYNMAVTGYVDDNTDPYDFLTQIHNIENKYGRDRSKEIRFGPRSLDIDIELFGDFTSNDEILQIPHPRISERAFVLIPSIEVLKKSADVNIRQKYSEYLKNLSDQTEHILKAEKDGRNGTVSWRKYTDSSKTFL